MEFGFLEGWFYQDILVFDRLQDLIFQDLITKEQI